ncbi:MAG: tRNA pseudouridine synthase A [Thermosphaera sp.]
MSLVDRGVEFIDHITRRAGYSNKWIVVRDVETDPAYGKLPYDRNIREHISYGVINLDKPPGPTSHEVVAWVKKLFNLDKAGHGGTLEPCGAGKPQGDRRTPSRLGQ